MDQELKQRLIGAVVVTALAAIFIPMLFDDPVDNSGQAVSELTIPDQPATANQDLPDKLPSNAAEVSGIPDNELRTSDLQESDISPEEIADSDREEGVLRPENEQLIDETKWIEESAGEDEPLEETDNNQAAALKPNLRESSKNQPVGDAAPKTATASRTKTPPADSKPSPPPTAARPAADLAKAGPAQADSGLARYYIQAGFFGKKENAVSLWENLRKQGLHAFIETVPTATGSFYRLKIGPELDKKRAAAIQARLKQQNIKTFIVSE
ncbi:MAG: SPOR domain-containing protein [Gammaproteobacteria bacterium]